MKVNIIVNTQFTALHSWDTCDIPEVMFLKDLHRHIFHVTIKIPVIHNDRDLEFFCVKKRLDEYISFNFANKELKGVSCETIAEDLILWLKWQYGQHLIGGTFYVSVMEDGENGAEVISD